ncbi:MAG: translation elongation factor Ts [Chloroflexota bacterium]
MQITASMVKELRDKTGAGVMEAKRALESSDGDEKKAMEILREQGLAKAAKREGRATSEGVVASYIHSGNRVGALVQLNCETDFVARTDEFINLAREIAMQVAAMSPQHLDRAQLSEEEAAHVTGDTVLMEQAYIRDPGTTVGELVKQLAGKTGENVHIGRFARFDVGE